MRTETELFALFTVIMSGKIYWTKSWSGKRHNRRWNGKIKGLIRGIMS